MFVLFIFHYVTLLFLLSLLVFLLWHFSSSANAEHHGPGLKFQTVGHSILFEKLPVRWTQNNCELCWPLELDTWEEEEDR
jgi:hypothetical protein